MTPRPLRLWPGILIVSLQWALRFGLPLVYPDGLMYSVMGGAVFGIFVVLWWAFFSRAPQLDRWSAIALMIAAVALTPRVLDRSIATGMMGFMFYIYVIPVLSPAFAAWAVLANRLPLALRRVTMVAAILLACAGFALIRTEGMTGDAVSKFAWRWAPSAEDRLVHASSLPAPVAPPPVVVEKDPAPIALVKDVKPINTADWPGFRGPHRDDVVTGVRIDINWAEHPPVQLWKHPVGPGWSSFSVRKGLIYTQEQRGADEIVSCYDLATGAPVWAHSDAARFWESNGGPGPRATPTLHNGRVYSFGATGIVNALDARTGSVVWTRNAATDTGVPIPEWGFASSPLVIDDEVIVAAAGKLAAYSLSTGEPRWYGADGGVSYSSPHLATIESVPQIVLLSTAGASSVAPDGTLLWKYDWKGYPIVQPAVTPDGDLLLSVSDSSGLRRLGITHGTAQERWTSMGLKPYFNDFVVHKDHAYGVDGSIIACIDLKDGKRAWKGGRYGHGQLLLLPDQDVILVTSEEGDIALVSATPEAFKELARMPGLEGKTWNHAVLAGDTLLVRNGEQMAAYKLTLLQ